MWCYCDIDFLRDVCWRVGLLGVFVVVLACGIMFGLEYWCCGWLVGVGWFVGVVCWLWLLYNWSRLLFCGAFAGGVIVS